MLGGTTGIADIFVALLQQMALAIGEIAVCLLLLLLCSRSIVRAIRLQLRHDHGGMMPWQGQFLHDHDPRPWLRRRSRRAVRRLAVSGTRQMRRLDAVVRG